MSEFLTITLTDSQAVPIL